MAFVGGDNEKVEAAKEKVLAQLMKPATSRRSSFETAEVRARLDEIKTHIGTDVADVVISGTRKGTRGACASVGHHAALKMWRISDAFVRLAESAGLGTFVFPSLNSVRLPETGVPCYMGHACPGLLPAQGTLNHTAILRNLLNTVRVPAIEHRILPDDSLYLAKLYGRGHVECYGNGSKRSPFRGRFLTKLEGVPAIVVAAAPPLK